MIISKTPFRVSFFGGGTDYPSWVKKHGGAVISTSIDKYCYITLRELPPFFKHKHRIVYSHVETVKEYSEIQHPAVKAIFKRFDLGHGLEMHHDGDLPARSGLGSSSSFCVGLINAINGLKGKKMNPELLANEAIYVEQKILKETVGYQDQIASAFGGFNKINFYRDGKFSVEPILIDTKRLEKLQDNLLLFFTGFSRFASEIAKEQEKNSKKNETNLFKIRELVDDAEDILCNSKKNLDDFGSLLNESWILKRSLSSSVSNNEIDLIYKKAIKAGAIGGKILGAGGGGFILFYVPLSKKISVEKALHNLIKVPFRFENAGSKIVLYNPSGF